jgi:glutamate/tyrosine decarboxylase-like PLP-dependent enzyme
MNNHIYLPPDTRIWTHQGFMKQLLHETAERASRYLAGLAERPVAPTAPAIAGLSAFDEALPEKSSEPAELLARLDDAGSPATVATAGGRYFGFVTGGALPASLAASWLAIAWDQNASLTVMSPVAARLEEIAGAWLVELLGLPEGSGFALTTGATLANLAGLSAARHALLTRQGWDVEARGLFGAPEITVVVSDEVHVSVLKALGLLGLGRERVLRVPTDVQGRLRADGLPSLDERTIVCLQAGNVNTGACDPARLVCERARAAGAWVHIDGAFGLWAAAAPARAHLVDGIDLADSWATDGHKWLNTPYDNGVAICRDPAHLRGAMAVIAPYLQLGDQREPQHYSPEFSRRARGVEVWAALRSLGRSGLSDLIERCCRHAERFAAGLRAAGHKVLNEVELNQVLVSFGDDATTRRVIAGVQADGTCWCGGTTWQGRAAMRISVSSWATTADDVEQSLEAICRVAAAEIDQAT